MEKTATRIKSSQRFSSPLASKLNNLIFSMKGQLLNHAGDATDIDPTDCRTNKTININVDDDTDLVQSGLMLEFSVNDQAREALGKEFFDASIQTLISVRNNASVILKHKLEPLNLEKDPEKDATKLSTAKLLIQISDYVSGVQKLNSLDVGIDFLFTESIVTGSEHWGAYRKFSTLTLKISNNKISDEFDPLFRPPEFFEPFPNMFCKFEFDSLTDDCRNAKLYLNEKYRSEIEDVSPAYKNLVRVELMSEVLMNDDFKVSEDYPDGSVGKALKKLFENAMIDQTYEIDLDRMRKEYQLKPIPIICHLLGESLTRGLLKK